MLKEKTTMGTKKQTKKYTFSVEGETEKWYFAWLEKEINKNDNSEFNIKISADVQQDPYKYAKKINPLVSPKVVHICDIEGKEDCDIKKFEGILENLKKARNLYSKKFQYELGYSNFTFELWIILHKQQCSGPCSNRNQYLPLINKIFGEHFKSLNEYKEKENFNRCLSKLSLDNVKEAIARAKQIMTNNKNNNLTEKEYKVFKYYPDNPSLTIYISIEKILKDCKLI